MNRGQLLDKAFKGEIKKGDKFINNYGSVMSFDGRYFRWESSENIVQMQVMDTVETFEKYDPKVTIELTQADINSLSVLMDSTSHNDLERMFEDQIETHEINGVARHIELRSTLRKLKK